MSHLKRGVLDLLAALLFAALTLVAQRLKGNPAHRMKSVNQTLSSLPIQRCLGIDNNYVRAVRTAK